MKAYLVLLMITLLSCSKQDNNAKSSDMVFSEIPYSVSYNYADSIAKKITPNKHFKYWQYVSYYHPYGSGNETYKILAEGGDTIYRKPIKSNFDPMESRGFFIGGHPSFRSNYLYTVDSKVNYLDSMEQLRDFIGEIDNLEEALLFAKSYNYVIGSKPIARVYNLSNDIYTLRLVKYSDSYPESLYRLRGELIELSITTKGFMKSRKLADYCEGRECLQ